MRIIDNLTKNVYYNALLKLDGILHSYDSIHIEKENGMDVEDSNNCPNDNNNDGNEGDGIGIIKNTNNKSEKLDGQERKTKKRECEDDEWIEGLKRRMSKNQIKGNTKKTAPARIALNKQRSGVITS